MTVLYKLETFEGPLDLLLHLIEKAEIDIRDISISEITDQYLAYLAAMQELELDITSEFLVMAATLLSIKSRELLPKPPVPERTDAGDGEEEEADPREELIRKLIEYRKYKAIAAELRERERERSLVFTREPADLTPYLSAASVNPVEGLGPADLLRAYRKVMRRLADRHRVAAIKRYEVTVKDRIRQLVQVLRSSPDNRQRLFSQLLGDRPSRQEIIVTFLALLELMKRKWIVCHQSRRFADILVTWTGRGDVDDGLPDDEIGA